VPLTYQEVRKGQVVELRFFRELSVEETAAVLRISLKSVTRDWKLARNRLRRELRWESQSGA
jgi:DNA-directed RNA polymerase specialized sigma24 family protein